MRFARHGARGVGEASGSTLVHFMARNGTELGVQLAGLPGRWFSAPAAPVQDALLREGLTGDDAALDIGDSPVISASAWVGWRSRRRRRSRRSSGARRPTHAARTRLMAEICAGRSRRFAIPALDFAAAPVGIDARLVVELGVAPQISTGVLHRSSGAGQIGAGVAHQPLAPFRAAFEAVVATLDG